ncbi:MAG: hypothetical protein CMJ58_14625 [Planctomycetaceae bacterium]|nr:hypothetical protein [Planctomycetaceae bacterium]
MLVGPVFTREVTTTPRSWRLYFSRALYVAALFGLVLTAWLILIGAQPVRSLDDLARFGAVAFALVAPVQLAVAMGFAALLTAAAVAQEKDRKTLDLLLMTNLNNSELVLGKLLASMLQVIVFVTAGIPLLMLLVLLGGVSYGQVARVVGVTACAAIAAGSLGSTIALWREKTFQTLAATTLTLVIWLLLGEAVGAGLLGEELAGRSATLWADAVSPLRAILAAAEPVYDARTPWPVLGAAGTAPGVFMVGAATLAVLLNLISIARVRVWNPSRELRPQSPDQQQQAVGHQAPRVLRVPGAAAAAPAGGSVATAASGDEPATAAVVGVARGQAAHVHADPAKTRRVWDNPILWREICTWAYGKKIIFIRLMYLAIGLACGAAALGWIGQPQSRAAALDADGFLEALIPLGVLGLVLVNALAVTSLTNERDGRALDLLLVTDLSPKEIIFGKLGGVFYNSKEMILLPLGVGAALWYRGDLSGENFLFLAIGLLTLTAFAAMLGIHSGMIYANSRTAVGVSLGTVLFLLLGIAVCMRIMLAFQTSFQNQFHPFAAFVFGGAVGLYVALGARRESPAIAWASGLAPIATFYSITAVLTGKFGAAFLVTVGVYGFATAAMLVPAIAEFDVTTGRTTAHDL